MLRSDGHREVDAAVSIAHVCLTFNEMLCEGGAYFVRVAVETQHSLGLAAVVEAFVGEQPAGRRGRVVRGRPEDFRAVEREFLEIVAQAAYGVVGLVHPGEYVLEHPGRRAGCRHELAPAVRLCRVCIGCRFFRGLLSQHLDAP